MVWAHRLKVLFCFGGLSFLIVLGVWQLKRLEFKSELAAQAESKMNEAPHSLEALQKYPPQRLNFSPAQIEGRPIINKPLRFLHATKHYGIGFRYIYPYVQHDGSVVFVDVGYAPDYEHSDIDQPPEAIPRPVTGPVSGILRRFADKGALTPENDTEKNIWFTHDLTQMAEYIGSPLALDAVLIVTRPSAQTFPLRTPIKADLPNNHLIYALTWFGLALAWGISSLAWLSRRPV